MVPMHRRFYVMETSCQICYGEEGDPRLVRDHDHATGFIRGTLCDKCNVYLGVIESRITRRKPKHKRWYAKYQGQIELHLRRQTAFKYTWKRRA